MQAAVFKHRFSIPQLAGSRFNQLLQSDKKCPLVGAQKHPKGKILAHDFGTPVALPRNESSAARMNRACLENSVDRSSKRGLGFQPGVLLNSGWKPKPHPFVLGALVGDKSMVRYPVETASFKCSRHNPSAVRGTPIPKSVASWRVTAHGVCLLLCPPKNPQPHSDYDRSLTPQE